MSSRVKLRDARELLASPHDSSPRPPAMADTTSAPSKGHCPSPPRGRPTPATAVSPSPASAPRQPGDPSVPRLETQVPNHEPPSPGQPPRVPPRPPQDPSTMKNAAPVNPQERRGCEPVPKKRRLLEASETSEAHTTPNSNIHDTSTQDILATACLAIGIDSDMVESVVDEPPPVPSHPPGALQILQKLHPQYIPPEARLRRPSYPPGIHPAYRPPPNGSYPGPEPRHYYHYPPRLHDPQHPLPHRMPVHPRDPHHYRTTSPYPPRYQYIAVPPGHRPVLGNERHLPPQHLHNPKLPHSPTTHDPRHPPLHHDPRLPPPEYRHVARPMVPHHEAQYIPQPHRPGSPRYDDHRVYVREGEQVARGKVLVEPRIPQDLAYRAANPHLRLGIYRLEAPRPVNPYRIVHEKVQDPSERHEDLQLKNSSQGSEIHYISNRAGHGQDLNKYIVAKQSDESSSKADETSSATRLRELPKPCVELIPLPPRSMEKTDSKKTMSPESVEPSTLSHNGLEHKSKNDEHPSETPTKTGRLVSQEEIISRDSNRYPNMSVTEESLSSMHRVPVRRAVSLDASLLQSKVSDLHKDDNNDNIVKTHESKSDATAKEMAIQTQKKDCVIDISYSPPVGPESLKQDSTPSRNVSRTNISGCNTQGRDGPSGDGDNSTIGRANNPKEVLSVGPGHIKIPHSSGHETRRSASEPPPNATETSFSSTNPGGRPASHPAANQSTVVKLIDTAVNDLTQTKINETEDDAVFIERLQLVLDDLVSVPEAMSIPAHQRSPQELLAFLVRQGGSDASTLQCPRQRLRRDFLTVVKRCLSKKQMDDWGWNTCTPEEILDQLIKVSYNGEVGLSGVARKQRTSTEDELDDEVFAPSSEVLPVLRTSQTQPVTQAPSSHEPTMTRTPSGHKPTVTQSPSNHESAMSQAPSSHKPTVTRVPRRQEPVVTRVLRKDVPNEVHSRQMGTSRTSQSTNTSVSVTQGSQLPPSSTMPNAQTTVSQVYSAPVSFGQKTYIVTSSANNSPVNSPISSITSQKYNPGASPTKVSEGQHLLPSTPTVSPTEVNTLSADPAATKVNTPPQTSVSGAHHLDQDYMNIASIRSSARNQSLSVSEQSETSITSNRIIETGPTVPSTASLARSQISKSYKTYVSSPVTLVTASHPHMATSVQMPPPPLHHSVASSQASTVSSQSVASTAMHVGNAYPQDVRPQLLIHRDSVHYSSPSHPPGPVSPVLRSSVHLPLSIHKINSQPFVAHPHSPAPSVVHSSVRHSPVGTEAPPLGSSAAQGPPFLSSGPQTPTRHSPVVHISPLHSPGSQAPPLRSPVAQTSPLHSPGAQAPPLRLPVAQAAPLRSPGAQTHVFHSPVGQVPPLRSPGAHTHTFHLPVAQAPPLRPPVSQALVHHPNVGHQMPLNRPPISSAPRSSVSPGQMVRPYLKSHIPHAPSQYQNSLPGGTDTHSSTPYERISPEGIQPMPPRNSQFPHQVRYHPAFHHSQAAFQSYSQHPPGHPSRNPASTANHPPVPGYPPGHHPQYMVPHREDPRHAPGQHHNLPQGVPQHSAYRHPHPQEVRPHHMPPHQPQYGPAPPTYTARKWTGADMDMVRSGTYTALNGHTPQT